ncbi:lactate/malate family dehydrogenase [Streptomyces spiramyceticus]|uniref:lactate/malate family dehydrogenase n=1 Tax=Streptomyces spiramyceticus TaxID=299717 RepID=UPI00237BB994|nr:NAD(P)-binding domain-containing protein [Streptomyces spiramyceticus]
MTAVAIVGAGAVGQSAATALVSAGLCDRLVVTSRTTGQAEALADDLDDLRSACDSRVHPVPGTTNSLMGCQAVVIAVQGRFANAHRADIRMAGAVANAPVIRTLVAELHGYTGTVVMVTNPVDLMTRLFAEISGCPRVFGIGSNLDTARYRMTLARVLDVPQEAVDGHVVGEHGDAAVVCTSSTTVNGEPVQVPLTHIRNELANRPGRISSGIGRTRCGPAGAVLSTLRLVLGQADGARNCQLHTRADGWEFRCASRQANP